MARYSISWTKTTGAAAGIVGQLRTGSTRDMRIYEVGVFTTTAVAGTVQLARSTAVGTSPTSTGTGAAHDAISGAGVAVVDTAATGITVATVPFRTAVFPATIGSGAIWTFPGGLVLPISSGLSLWQTTTAAVGYAAYFEYEE